MNKSSKGQRKSLRESLRTILRRGFGDTRDTTTDVGSGILRRQDPSLVLLPSISSVSLLPDFESSRYHVDNYSLASCELSPLRPHHQARFDESVTSLLPKRSLSQIQLRETFDSDVRQGQGLEFRRAPSIYRSEASLGASLSTLGSLGKSVSTLKLRSSNSSLGARSRSTASLSTVSTKGTTVSSIRHYGSRSQVNLHKAFDEHSAVGVPTPRSISSVEDPRNSRRLSILPEIDAGLNLVDHFSSFCVLDSFAPGYPVVATSKDLRYVFDIGEQFVLNNQCIEGASMDIVTGSDAEGSLVTHLVLYSPLIIPSSGRSRFVLASMVDVTPFIKDTASLPDLETISEESFFEEELQTPRTIPTIRETQYELSAEDLLGGCYVDDKPVPLNMDHRLDDIWLDIASSEKELSRSSKSSRSSRSVRSARSSRSSRSSTGAKTSRTSTTASTATTVDGVLEQFLSGLQELYSDFFLLGKSPLDEDSYEICNVSPRVHVRREFVNGHLSRTPSKDRALLESRLAQDHAFRTMVRWGEAGLSRQLFCVPLFGRQGNTWICFLVEPGKLSW